MSRDRRRAALKEILKDYENGGFNPKRFLTVFGLVRELVEILNDRANARRMSDAGALVMKVYDACAKVHGRPQELACKKGCGYCCHTRVTVTVPEIFLLARAARKRWDDPADDLRGKFEAQEKVTRGLSESERFATRTACPILTDNACGMYEPRPLTCRAYASKSLPACLNLYNNGVHNIPQSEVSQTMRSIIYAGLKAALAEAGLDGTAYELGHALAVAVDRGAEARWLAGEPLFAEVGQEVREAVRSEGHRAFDLMVDVLRAGAFGRDLPQNPYFAWPA